MQPRFFFLVFLFFISPHFVYAKPAQSLSLGLDWFVNPDHAPIIVAYEMGLYKKAGIDLDIQVPSDPNLPPKLVASKKLDLAISYQPQLYLMKQASMPVVRAASLIGQPLNSLVFLEGSGIKSPKDLQGKKIGYSIGGFERVALGAILQQADLSLEDVELININFALTQSLLLEKVDAVIGAFRNFELHQLALQGAKGVAWFVEDFGLSSYEELIFLVHQDAPRTELIEKFLEVTQEAITYIQKNPEKSWKHFIAYDSSLNDKLNSRAWDSTLPLFSTDMRSQPIEAYASLQQTLVESGFIEKAISLEEFFWQP